MVQAGLQELLGRVAAQAASGGSELRSFLGSLHLEELVLARACVAGNERAWEVFLNRYRATLYETAHKIAGDHAAAQPETALSDPRVENAVASELRTLQPEERFLLASYFLDRKTLAEIAKLLRVHESTVSRKLERVTKDVRKRIRKRLVESGMPSRQADELMEDVDVRDLQVSVRETLQQDSTAAAFYKGKGESQG